MQLARLRLRDFRNYARLDAVFTGGFHVILGDNAQGKTNLLEAIYLLATLRSFRGVGGSLLVRHGASGYFIGAQVLSQTAHEVKLYWSPTERRVSLDAHPVRRVTDYLSTFRAVVFCSEDLQLVKGTGRSRRRFLDLLLSQTQPGYLTTLQRYTRALRSRNALLRNRAHDPDALAGFTQELIQAGQVLMQSRASLLPKLAPLVQAAHGRIAPRDETVQLNYQPQVRGDFAVALAQSQPREQAQRLTLVGPHRDELLLHVNEQPAARFGSEGQKRTLALALKMAQVDYLRSIHGTPPVLLLDDVMGELDLRRRSGLVPLLLSVAETRGQIFMTCTEESWPRELGNRIHRWVVRHGCLSPTPD